MSQLTLRRPWEDHRLVREIRSPTVRKHRIGPP